MKKIIIIGGGFAGLNLAKDIKNTSYEIILVDKNNYVFFPPLLYQVATGFLEPSNISYPYRKLLRDKKNVRFVNGSLVKIDVSQQKVLLDTGTLSYDYLVMATGTVTNYFGMENVKKNAIPMKTLNDALEMRNFLLKQLEEATRLLDNKKKLKEKLNIVVAGGGPTGVEISGMLAELRKTIFKKDYPEFNKLPVNAHIYLVDGSAQLLSPMSKKAQESTLLELKKIGVKVYLNTQVTDFSNQKVILSNGKIIETENLIWAAGVTSQKFDGIPEHCFGRGKRLQTDAFNAIEGLQNAYAIGDNAIQFSDPNFRDGHPQVAQVALQQAKNLAINFDNLANGKPLKEFSYHDKGSMAIIGRNKAVADLPKNLHFKGFFAWFIWVFVHLISLMHYRNKIATFYNWSIAYFTKDHDLRMIIRPNESKTTNPS
jgi:NADH:ubiquinone reductase (H+-translocating)